MALAGAQPVKIEYKYVYTYGHVYRAHMCICVVQGHVYVQVWMCMLTCIWMCMHVGIFVC